MDKSTVVARLTGTREIGNVTIIEVHQDANFHEFYRIYTQVGRRRSTKRLVRTANRNHGLEPWFAAHRMQPGLEVLAAKWRERKGLTVNLRIIQKRAYRKLINASADQLGPLPEIRNPFPVKNPKAAIMLLLPTKPVSVEAVQ